ncbi:unnamed protein product [Spirodela intermedia]|uniref:Uncharacterized protein n=1 Tax=Spirodela intermedia TaxID=51605 RepID=A0A7I8J970_SPIIN|nr:unnamed protein product [Spirodela intermedia]CAA6666531.1 unnamed protein product [Spirodela intermedia]
MDVGRGRWPHAGASLVDPLLIVPREETHDFGPPLVCAGGAKGERSSRLSPR